MTNNLRPELGIWKRKLISSKNIVFRLVFTYLDWSKVGMFGDIFQWNLEKQLIEVVVNENPFNGKIFPMFSKSIKE